PDLLPRNSELLAVDDRLLAVIRAGEVNLSAIRRKHSLFEEGVNSSLTWFLMRVDPVQLGAAERAEDGPAVDRQCLARRLEMCLRPRAGIEPRLRRLIMRLAAGRAVKVRPPEAVMPVECRVEIDTCPQVRQRLVVRQCA